MALLVNGLEVVEGGPLRDFGVVLGLEVVVGGPLRDFGVVLGLEVVFWSGPTTNDVPPLLTPSVGGGASGPPATNWKDGI